ncbi:hypothetical protein AURDEDRAFT_117424 [Auricularia subglabra TFB-10046 SS5]|uniref:Uncharacterized protein n=1 Tax=Auricularia subglabra (strain TFB-10046 / SS5) TaxID=717982 RepID=J0WSU6_AURST|nr:hypothetical protein AURDEDRAFT_117424 [Auricularia subglabra TFB-10046 SS5]
MAISLITTSNRPYGHPYLLGGLRPRIACRARLLFLARSLSPQWPAVTRCDCQVSPLIGLSYTWSRGRVPKGLCQAALMSRSWLGTLFSARLLCSTISICPRNVGDRRLVADARPTRFSGASMVPTGLLHPTVLPQGRPRAGRGRNALRSPTLSPGLLARAGVLELGTLKWSGGGVASACARARAPVSHRLARRGRPAAPGRPIRPQRGAASPPRRPRGGRPGGVGVVRLRPLRVLVANIAACAISCSP